MHSLLELAGSDQTVDLICAELLHAEKFRAVCVLLMSAPAVFGSVDESVVVCDRGSGRNGDQMLPFITRITGFFLQLPRSSNGKIRIFRIKGARRQYPVL